MARIWERLQETFPRRVVFPCGFKMDQFPILNEEEVGDVQRFNILLKRGATTEGPSDMPTFKWDAVATRPPHLRFSDLHINHFDVRVEKDIR
eukprot:contig_2877_g587